MRAASAPLLRIGIMIPTALEPASAWRHTLCHWESLARRGTRCMTAELRHLHRPCNRVKGTHRRPLIYPQNKDPAKHPNKSSPLRLITSSHIFPYPPWGVWAGDAPCGHRRLMTSRLLAAAVVGEQVDGAGADAGKGAARGRAGNVAAESSGARGAVESQEVGSKTSLRYRELARFR